MNFWNDPVAFIADWLSGIFAGWGMPEFWSNLLVFAIGIFVLIAAIMVVDIFLVWIERKVVARFQDRLGPNRLGPYGLIQPFADIIKLLIKEDITPRTADKVVYNLAPILSMSSVLILWAIIPLAPLAWGVDLNVGVLYLVAAGAIGALSIIMAGWASDNKYALLGAFRQVATMISYEIPMVAALLIPVMLAGTMSMQGIVEAQTFGEPGVWFILVAPLAALIFAISSIAELGRSPFDLNEAESELVSGYHIEYSGMKFGMFYAGELLHAFTFGGFWGILFFGGYSVFGLETLPGLQWLSSPFIAVFMILVKALVGYWIIMWVKYTVPRIRIDHMLAFNWKILVPLSFTLIMLVAVLNKLLLGYGTLVYVAGMFLANVLLAIVTIMILGAYARRQRLAEEAALQIPARAAGD
ncbi:MAG: NADH-quinone oxidoreductase subunit NuoH [Anaerolineales bacterium]|nr:NADH-quinone oxidoreductase subunit NuoH [Anaerolineales bacterium]